MWLAEVQRDTGAAYKAFNAGDYHNYLKWINNFMIALGKSTDPPLAKKATVNIYYCLRPVVDYAFKFGEYPLTEKVITTFIDTFTDKEGNRLYPYDMGLNANIFIVNNLVLQTKYEEALDKMIKFVNIDTSIPYSYYILGLLYEKNNKIQQAFESIESAIKANPYDPVFVLQYANLLAKYKKISLGDAYLQERSQFFYSKNLPNSARILDYFRICLSMDPEEDSIDTPNILSTIDDYSLEVFQ
jgi:tetratricopeptide (TPR) repeat protein